MNPEDRLRQAVEARTSDVEPSTDSLSRIEEKLMDAQRSNTRKRVLIGLGAVAAVAALVVAAIVLTDDDDEPVSSDDTTTTSEVTSTSESSTTESTTTTVFQGVDPDVTIFPDPTTSQRFTDPESAAREFATFAGYTHPAFGQFQPVDARSGDIEIRPSEQGPPTVVTLRQLEDDSWYVVGVSTDAIRVATPEDGARITSPQPLRGQAYAYEGNVVVRLFVDGVQEPVAQTNVTGRGDNVLGDFSGQLEFTNDTGATHGVLVFFGTSGEDGGATEVEAIRVRL